jgi:solute carrier family 25 carnitine/acylcarnitine transporter 20/29
MEHIKCRLQVQHGKGSADYKFKGPVQAIRSMVREHGITRLYQGWWVTTWREVPAFGLYFATYDYLKDWANTFLLSRALAAATVDGRDDDPDSFVPHHSHTWLASAFAGGCAGSLTWAIVYPVDVIKTRIQTAPLDQPRSQLRMLTVGADLVRQYGVRYLFRGLSVTLLRAFPVNGTIFPVYEFTLLQVGKFHAE